MVFLSDKRPERPDVCARRLTGWIFLWPLLFRVNLELGSLAALLTLPTSVI